MAVKSLDELYSKQDLYSSKDMFSPPSERLSHVLRLELTTGCDWRRCTYCAGYDGVRFKEKTLDEYIDHMFDVFTEVGYRTPLARNLRRIFIGGGNALGYQSTRKLGVAIDCTARRFEEYTGNKPSRIATYGRTGSIVSKGAQNLRFLHDWAKLSLIYWGVESGSDEVLDYVNKGCTKEKILEAAKVLHSVSGLDSSVMIMPGLGGAKYYESHINDTVAVLNEIRPRFLTLMGINAKPNLKYAHRMQAEQEAGENRPLTDVELAKQMIEIIQGLNFHMKMGCFETKVDAVGYNPFTFGSVNYNPGHCSGREFRDSLTKRAQKHFGRKEFHAPIKVKPEPITPSLLSRLFGRGSPKENPVMTENESC